MLERYFDTDDLGRNSEGKPAQLYPKDWHKTVSAFGTDKGQVREVSAQEQALIKALVTKAIDEGFVQRGPDQRAEVPFMRRLAPANDNGPATWITGSIDLAAPGRVEDHKTSKSTRWLKSKAKLKTDPQMLCYGRELLQIYKDQGLEPPDTVTLCHNGFVKDPEKPLVRKTEVVVERERIEAHWTSKVLPMAEALHTLKYVDKPETWQDVEGAEPGSGACEAYGGCEFASICTGRETLVTYKERVQAKNSSFSRHKGETKVSSPSQTGATTMSSFAAQLAKRRAAKAKAKAAPAEKPSEPQVTEAEKSPPWAQADCKACGGKGFNSKGNPCRICDMRSGNEGNPTSADFTMVVDGGVINWEGLGLSGTTILAKPVQAKDNTKPEAPKPEPEPEPEPEIKATPPVKLAPAKPEPAPEPKKTKAKKKMGRPKAGFTLLINCAPAYARKTPVLLDRLLAEFHEQMAVEAEATGASFYDLDPFKRRDAICKALESYDFGTSIVVASDDTPDKRSALEVLKARAEAIFVGLR